MKNAAIALIIARPGPLRDSLQRLLASVRQIQIVAESEALAALLQPGAQLIPDLLLVEAALLEKDGAALLQTVKARWPQTRALVLVENAGQQQAATAGGADAVLYQGYPAGRLVALVEELLAGREPAGPGAA